MAQIFQGLQGVIVFIDDILVTGRTREEHTRNLWNVLDHLRQAGLRLRESKCLFFQESLEYLGHVISKEGIRPTNKRVKCVREAPPPQNKQQLQSFLGLMTYNAKFLPSLSYVLHLQNSLLRKMFSGSGQKMNKSHLKLPNLWFPIDRPWLTIMCRNH